MSLLRSSRGFTVVELSVVLFVLSLIAVLTTPNIVNSLNERRANYTAAETQLILDAARSYRAQTGDWPGNGSSLCGTATNVLSTGAEPYLYGIDSTNQYNSVISTSCTAKTFSVDQGTTDGWAGFYTNSLPGTVVVNTGTGLIRTTIGVPGTEPALDSKLSREWNGNAELNRMRTELLLGGNNISEVGTLNAQRAVLSTLLDAQGEARFAGTATFNGTAAFNGAVGMNGPTTFNNSATFKQQSIFDGQATFNNAASFGRTTTFGGLATFNNQARFVGQTQFDARAHFRDTTYFAGNATFDGGVTINGTTNLKGEVILHKIVNEGGGCAVNGSLGRKADGTIMSCVGGKWAGGAGGELDGPYVLSANGDLGKWKLCTLGYTSGNVKQLTYNNGNWSASIDGTKRVYCYR